MRPNRCPVGETSSIYIVLRTKSKAKYAAMIVGGANGSKRRLKVNRTNWCPVKASSSANGTARTTDTSHDNRTTSATAAKLPLRTRLNMNVFGPGKECPRLGPDRNDIARGNCVL